jgi:hypothetical protein
MTSRLGQVKRLGLGVFASVTHWRNKATTCRKRGKELRPGAPILSHSKFKFDVCMSVTRCIFAAASTWTLVGELHYEGRHMPTSRLLCIRGWLCDNGSVITARTDDAYLQRIPRTPAIRLSSSSAFPMSPPLRPSSKYSLTELLVRGQVAPAPLS